MQLCTLSTETRQEINKPDILTEKTVPKQNKKKRVQPMSESEKKSILLKLQKHQLDQQTKVLELKAVMMVIDSHLRSNHLSDYIPLKEEDSRNTTNQLRWFDHNWNYIDQYLTECNSKAVFGPNPFKP